MSIQGAKETLMQGAQYVTDTVTGSGNSTSATNESQLGRDRSAGEEVSSGPLAGIQPEHNSAGFGSSASSGQETTGSSSSSVPGNSSAPLTAYERAQRESASAGPTGLDKESLSNDRRQQQSSGLGSSTTGNLSSGPLANAGRQEGGSVAPIPGGHATSGLTSDGSEISTGVTREAPGSQYWQETDEVGIFDTKDGRKTYAPDGHLTRSGAPPVVGAMAGKTAGDMDVNGGRGVEGAEDLDTDASRGQYDGSRDAGRGVEGADGFDTNASRGQYDSSRDAAVTDTTGPGAPRDQTNADTAATQNNVNVPTSGDPGATDAAERNKEGSGADNPAGKSNKSTHLENEDAIPFAGDKKVGQDHYGESKLQPRAV